MLNRYIVLYYIIIITESMFGWLDQEVICLVYVENLFCGQSEKSEGSVAFFLTLFQCTNVLIVPIVYLIVI